MLWPIAPTAQVVERSQKAIDEVVLVAVVAISRVNGTGGSFRAISIEAPHQPDGGLAENSVGVARRGGLARAHAAVKKHPGYSESGYLLAVEIAFTNWEAIQNIGRQDRPG